MKDFDYRWIYAVYLIGFILVAIILSNKYCLSNNAQNTASLVANTSELYGLSVALTEIFLLSNIANKIKKTIASLQSYSDISSVSIFLSQTKDDLLLKKYSRAVVRLEGIRDVYQENLPEGELDIPSSSHRKNLDMLNSIITALTMAESSGTIIPHVELQQFVKFITIFNETLTSLKLTFKKSIV